MITWDKSIAIIKMTFGIAQSKMGELLGFDKTTISKVKSGKQPPPFSSEDVFEKIFNPHIENSPANAISTSEAYLLGVLKEIIQAGFPTVKTEMLDCWEETNYKVFVMELLGRTRQGGPKKTKTDETVCRDASLPTDTSHTDIGNCGSAQISVPSQYMKCVFCAKWKCRTNYVHAINTDVYGTCIVYGRDQLSSAGTDCRHYEPNYGRITPQMLQHRT